MIKYIVVRRLTIDSSANEDDCSLTATQPSVSLTPKNVMQLTELRSKVN